MPILEPKRDFIKASEVTTGDEIKFVNAGEWVESRKFKNLDGTNKQQFIIQVEYAGQEKSLSLNATNRQNLIAAFGRDTQDWVGKSAKIELIKMNVAGAIKPIIFLEPIK